MNLGLIPTLFLFFGIFSIVYALTLQVNLAFRDQKVIKHWRLGAFLWGISVILTIFRGELSLILSYFSANALAFVANLQMIRGLKALSEDDRKSVFRKIDLFYFLAYAGLLYSLQHFVPAPYQEFAKTSFVSAVMVAVALMGMRFCFEAGKKNALKLATRLGYLYGVVAFLWGMRIVAALTTQVTSAFDTSLVNTLIFISIFITGIFRYLIFPMILLQKSDNEKQKYLKESLAKANRSWASDALSASIAHELNQPLASIRLNGQILKKALQAEPEGKIDLTQAEFKEVVQEILGDSERAAKIISSLRSIFIQHKRRRQDANLSELMASAIRLVKNDVQGITLQLDFCENVKITVPEEEFNQVFLNLLKNSIQALKAKGVGDERVIRISSKMVGEEVEIQISDNGPGVPEEIQPYLFDLLSTSKETGMGVGLWLSQYIINRHSGEIAHVPSKNSGATFKITLPMALGNTLPESR